MKAVAIFPKRPKGGEVRLVEHEPPRLLAPTAVKLRVLEVGVCGTDKEIAAFKYGTPPLGSDYLILGHESLGEVVEVGPEVKRLQLGDLVVPMVRRPCPHPECRACRAGRQDFCYTGDFTERGIKEAHGFMTELVVDDNHYMNVVPQELRDVAVLVEPLSIAEKALLQVWEVQKRLPWPCRHVRPEGPAGTARKPSGHNHDDEAGQAHHALVLGAGPVGLLGAMALVVAGFDTSVYSRQPPDDPRARLVETFGARYLSSVEHAVPHLPERIGNIDLVYEATGASRLAFEVLEVLGTNGIFIFTGVPGRKAPIEVDTDLIMRDLVLRNQLIFGTVNAGRDAFEAAIHDLGVFMARWPRAVRALITGRYPVESFSELLREDAPGIKNVLVFHGGS